ncbi:MAG: S-layer homology domain-containing protein [Candidatus Cloacimonetes bacterium]|nr:S-layer homology domain-containing protein [Candidatus Cloacimonadota bacterium]
MKIRKKLFIEIIILTALLVTSCASANKTFNFSDVPDDHWAYSDIIFAVRRDLIRYTTKHEFFPEKMISRAEIARALTMLTGVGSGYTGSTYDYIANYNNAIPFLTWSIGMGNMRFPTDISLDPHDEITREQFALMVLNCAAYLGKGPVGAWTIRLDFQDIEEISDWSYEGVMFCYLKNIIIPNDDNFFSPKSYVNRAEAAHILHRFAEVILD